MAAERPTRTMPVRPSDRPVVAVVVRTDRPARVPRGEAAAVRTDRPAAVVAAPEEAVLRAAAVHRTAVEPVAAGRRALLRVRAGTCDG